MRKIIITTLLILANVIVIAQIKENLVRMATKNSQFIEKYYPNQLIRIADSLPIFSLTRATQIGQTMKIVFDSGWYKVITPAPALSMTEPKYFVVLTDSVSVLPTKYPVAPLLSGAVSVTDTTGLDPLCTGLTIYSLADSTLWQHRPVIDTITGDTIGCEWIDMSTNPYVPNPTIVMSNGSLVPWSDVVAIRQRTPVTFNTKAVPLGSEWYVGVDTVTTKGVATQYDLSQLPSLWDTTNITLHPTSTSYKVHIGSTDTPDSTFQVTGGAKFTGDVVVNGVRVGRGNETGVHAGYDHNLVVGREALSVNTGGNYNTAVGTLSLTANTTGAANTAVGHKSLAANIGGLSNTGIGSYALMKNTSGTNNTAIGYNTLVGNTSGHNNTSIGGEGLNKNTTGINNSTVGYQSLAKNTTGSYNTANGRQSLYSNTTGYSNTAVGVSALYSNTTKSNLVAVGDSALYENTAGEYNTAIGSKTLYQNTIGSSNTATGFNALTANTTGNHNTSMGLFALSSNSTGAMNTAIGSAALNRNTTGNRNVAIGCNAGRYITDGVSGNKTGNYSIFIGGYTQANADGQEHQIVIGYNTTGKGSNTTTIGNTSTTDTYLAGALTVDSIPDDPSADSVVTTKNGKLYRAKLPIITDYTATSPINVSEYNVAILSDTLTSWRDKQNKGNTAYGWGNGWTQGTGIQTSTKDTVKSSILRPTNKIMFDDIGDNVIFKTSEGMWMSTDYHSRSDSYLHLFNPEIGGWEAFSSSTSGNQSYIMSILTHRPNIIYSVESKTGKGTMIDQDTTSFGPTSAHSVNLGRSPVPWDTTFTNKLIVADSVGIGTTVPATALDMGASGVITTSGGTSTNWNTAYGWGSHAGLYPPIADSSKWQYNGNDIWYTNGKVGIGTTAPGYELDVSGNINGSTAIISPFFRRSNGNVYLQGEDDVAIICDYNNNDAGTRAIIFGANTGITPSGTEVLGYWKESGNLGINTTSPSSKLHVNGAARIADSTKMLGPVYMTALPDKAGGHELFRDVSTGEISYNARVSRHTPSGDSIPSSALASTIFLSPTGNITFNDAAGGVMEGTYDGQQVTIINLSGTYTATFKVTGNILDAGGSDVELGSGESIVIIWAAEETKWYFINKTPSL